MPEDIAITSSKSDVDPCRQTDRQTDGFSALYSRCVLMVVTVILEYFGHMS